MIGSAHRFHGRSSLRFVYQRGQMVRGPLISLRYAKNDRQRSYRMAVVVSRKVSKSAVRRNRIRRRLYEIVRKKAGQISGPYDMVFAVYGEEMADLAPAELQKVVLGLMKKSGVLGSSEADHGIVNEKENKS